MKKKLMYLSLIILIPIYIIIAIFSNTKQDILIIGGNIYIEYNDKKYNIKNNYKNNPQLNYRKYKVYDGEKYIDGYIKFYKDDITGDTNGIIYNSTLDISNLSIPLLAYTGNINIDVADTVVTDKISDNDEIILKSKLTGIIDNIDDINFKKITVDLNNDNQNEYIYFIYKYDNDKIYNSIFMMDSNNRIIDIVTNGEKNEEYNINYIVDVDMDGEYEIVLSSSYGYSLTNYEIYKLKNNKFEKLE